MTAAPGTLLRRPTAPAADGAIHRIAPPDAGFAWISFAVHRLEPGQELVREGDDHEVGIVVAESDTARSVRALHSALCAEPQLAKAATAK